MRCTRLKNVVFRLMTQERAPPMDSKPDMGVITTATKRSDYGK